MNDPYKHFQEAIDRFDAANEADPNLEMSEGKACPKELLYAQRMTARLAQYEPDASEALRLAARAQHICRWKIPRNEYSLDRDGYRLWRTALAQMHGDIAAEIMRQVGYPENMCAQVSALLQKDRMTLAESDGQTLEDVVCLVFLEFYFVPFAAQYSPAKLASIVRKTWNKMSARGQQAALALAPLWPADLRVIVQQAVA